MRGVSSKSFASWVQEERLPRAIGSEDINDLLQFIDSKLLAEGDKYYDFGTTPETWDTGGVIEKVYRLLESHIKTKFVVKGDLTVRKLFAVKTAKNGYYYDRYWELEEGARVRYSGVLTLSDGYEGGQSIYFRVRKSTPEVGDMMAHRHEKLNSWAINTVTSGVRLDIILTLEELEKD